jgi:phosphoglycerol transferase MdoB-like AlkP superfamily enzyme
MSKLRLRSGGLLPPEALFTAGLYGLLLTVFALLRGLLLWRNAGQAAGIPAATLAESFLVGLRFDLAVSSYLLLPFFLLLLLLRGRRRAWAVGGLCLLVGGLVLLGLAEIEFYRELEMRFNTLVFEYLSHPQIVGGMIWAGYPVFRYLLVWGALTILFAAGAAWLYRRLLHDPPAVAGAPQALARTMGGTVLLALMIFASRGGFAHEPLRWGDAFFCEATFANHLALNGVFTLARSAVEKFSGSQAAWTRAQPEEEARRTTQAMLRLPGEAELAGEQFPLLRREPAAAVLRRDPQRPVNVVVILMESFSGRHVGALGAQPSLTPEFDRLGREGVLFERAFSNGTHTHQGVFASLASFPNLPGYEYLMKTLEAHQEFSGLPSLLHPLGYQTLFLYNGLFSWDNKEGFFRQHGIDRFIGTADYVNPTFVDPVWGVSDHDVFTRANQEFRAMAQKGPFFAAILTLSNHSPFNLPEPLPFERIRTGDDREGRYNAMRYADWALGEFFRQASREEYFQNTLFVLTGDHGFGVPPALTGMQLERFHVPLLFYAPAMLPTGRRVTVASQVDIAPSVLGLLGLDLPHQCWGRNLFSAALQDEGFAVVKPSGGEEKVALIEGDRILIAEPKEKPRLYRYDLAFPPLAEPLDEPQRLAAMKQKLQAYVETGILALRGRRLGVPAQAPAVAGALH